MTLTMKVLVQAMVIAIVKVTIQVQMIPQALIVEEVVMTK